MMWRVNFGNGQVHECRSRREALDLLALQDGYAFIQRYVGDDHPDGWARVRT